MGSERKVKIVVSEDRAQEFNMSALAVMKKHGVHINDLYSLIGKDRLKYQRGEDDVHYTCLLYTSPSPRDLSTSRMPSSA